MRARTHFLLYNHLESDMLVFASRPLNPPTPDGGEPPGERHLRGGEQDPGAAHPDQPVPTQAASRQHQPAQHVPERSHRRGRERRHRPVPGGRGRCAARLLAAACRFLFFSRQPNHRRFPVLSPPQAFFDKDYISSHSEDTERITHLKDLMQEQVGPRRERRFVLFVFFAGSWSRHCQCWFQFIVFVFQEDGVEGAVNPVRQGRSVPNT